MCQDKDSEFHHCPDSTLEWPPGWGPKVTFNFEGLEITTHMDASHYLYDDLYGYSLGYLQGQGLKSEMMSNSSMWISFAEEKCNKIQEKYNFQNEELILADWLDDNTVINTKVSCAAGMPIPPTVTQTIRDAAKYKSFHDCEPVTRREFAKHHYIKCLLGYQNAASDGAYLNMRACLLDGGTRIGHFSDCPYSPDISFWAAQAVRHGLAEARVITPSFGSCDCKLSPGAPKTADRKGQLCEAATCD